MPAVKTPTLSALFAGDGPLARLLPGYEPREEQVKAAEAVERAFRRGRHCLIEAGTGVGKSLAYLIPAARAIAEGKRVVISTHTINLQTQLVEKDIPLVVQLFPDVDIRPVLMKGRGNYLCLQDLDSAEEDLFIATDPLFKLVKEWARTTQTGDAAELPFVFPQWHEVAANIDTCRRQECRYYDRCFYYRMRRNAALSNLFIVNHALFLSDLAVRRGDPENSLLPDYDFVVFDEAHHLEEVATRVFGIELTNRTIPRLVERIRRTRDIEVDLDRLQTLQAQYEELFRVFDSPRSEFFFHDVLDELAEGRMLDSAARLLITLEQVQTELTTAAKESVDARRDRLEGLARTAARLREEAHLLFFEDSTGYIRWGGHSGSGDARGRQSQHRTTLHYTPVEVGPILEEALWKCVRSTILTSATLSNSGGFGYIRSRLGMTDPPDEVLVGSPFDYARQALLYVPAHLPEVRGETADAFIDAAAEELERLMNLTRGRAFLLFTSRRVLNKVFERLEGRLEMPLFRQGDMPPGLLLDAFRSSGNGILFGTQTFWEGVDVPGDALSCVVIDRLPFAVPDSPITRARTDAIKAAGGDWFADFSMPQAQIRLKQGFGRLIRTRTDRGIVCILDTRLLTKSYGREFIRHLPPACRASLWSRVERFWNQPDI